MPKQSIAEQLERADRILRIATGNTELQTRLAQVGYDPAAIRQAQTLYETARGARTNVHTAHGVQLNATDTVEELRAQVETNISALSQTARAIFADDPGALETLGLRVGQRATPDMTDPQPVSESTPPTPRQLSRSQAALLDRARTLYDGALQAPTLLTALEGVGYPRARLETERNVVESLAAADASQEQMKATAQARTADQREALDALNEWISRFRGIVKVALRDRPDLLDALGL